MILYTNLLKFYGCLVLGIEQGLTVQAGLCSRGADMLGCETDHEEGNLRERMERTESRKEMESDYGATLGSLSKKTLPQRCYLPSHLNAKSDVGT